MKKNMYLIATLILFFLCGCGTKTSSTSTYLSSNEYTSVSKNENTSVSENEIDYKSDLVYYGVPAIWREKGDIIVIDLTVFDEFERIAKVCIRNCRDDYEVYLPISREIKYSVEKDGSYYVYAVLNNGTVINLFDNTGVEGSYTNGTGNAGFIEL